MSTFEASATIVWKLEDTLYVNIGEPKRFKEGAGQRRTGFRKAVFDKQFYVTITLTDCSKGHGLVKSVILRNPPAAYLAKISSPEYWEIRPYTMTLVTEEGNRVDRTFRVVYLKTPDGEEVMSNTLLNQMKNLATNSPVRMPDGGEERVVAYINAKGGTESLVEDDEADDVAEGTAKA